MRSLAIILLWFFVSNVYAVHFAAPEDNDESCSFWWGPCEKNAAPINEDARIVREPTQTADGSTMRT
jgi:hypothetical protein